MLPLVTSHNWSPLFLQHLFGLYLKIVFKVMTWEVLGELFIFLEYHPCILKGTYVNKTTVCFFSCNLPIVTEGLSQELRRVWENYISFPTEACYSIETTIVQRERRVESPSRDVGSLGPPARSQPDQLHIQFHSNKISSAKSCE